MAAATSKSDQRTSFSNFGLTTVDVGAPGKIIWSTTAFGDYDTGVGTSFACPHVTGAAALMLSVNPTLTVEELRDRIMDNVDPVKDLAGITVTGGRLNTFRAVSAALWP